MSNRKWSWLCSKDARLALTTLELAVEWDALIDNDDLEELKRAIAIIETIIEKYKTGRCNE